MKRFLFFLTLLIILASITIFILSNDVNKRFHIEKPKVLQNIQAYPICFLLDHNNSYNLSLPYRNEIDEFFVKDNISVIDRNSIVSILLNKSYTGNIFYEIIQPLTKEIIVSNEIKEKKVIAEGSNTKMNIQLENLEDNTEYILKIILKEGKEKTYYYHRIYTGNINQTDLIKTVLKVHNLMFEGDKEYKKYILPGENGGKFYYASHESSENILLWNDLKDFVKMNEPVPEIISYNPKTNIFEVKMTFTVAIRNEYSFEYWDFTEVYMAEVLHDEVMIKEFKRYANRKNEPYFDENRLQWILDEGTAQEVEQNIISESNQYNAFVYKNEIYLLDKKYNTLNKVFGFDSLDSDYLMDESVLHNLKLLEVDNKGNIKYLVYGYMAAGEFAGYNGIMASYYNNSKIMNENNILIKMNLGYKELKYYLENYSYYNLNSNLLFLKIKDELFELDLNKKTFNNLLTLPGSFEFSEEGIVFSKNKTKDNMGIQIIDLRSNKNPEIKNIAYEKTNIRMLGLLNDAIVIGTYNVKNTYEYLNSEVFYPYNDIKILDFDGNIIKTISAKEDKFLGDIVINKEEGVIYATDYYLSKQISSNPRNSKISYIKTDTQEIYKFTSKSILKEPIIENILINEINTILINNSGISLYDSFVPTAANSIVKSKLIEGEIKHNNINYEIYNNNELISISHRIDEALTLARDYQDTILYINEGEFRKEIYNSTRKDNSIYLNVPLILQRPELIRGCESTALAMFLSYYKKEGISKISLAEKLRKDETPMETTNGIISFGDMHKGFVGSIIDRNQPGLGVYVEPLYDLAKNYIEDVYNITGSSINQVLSMVSEGRPVLIIMPANYNKASNRVLEYWQTPSGYMEVTYLEHSAVISGYDDNYVYLNDPQYSKVIKRDISDFIAGWESMGSQALVVIE